MTKTDPGNIGNKNKKPGQPNKAKAKAISPGHARSRPTLKWLLLIGYILFLLLLLGIKVPFMAEQYASRYIPDNIENHLTFYSDGQQSHYIVERANSSTPGRIDVYYYPASNTLQTNLVNIRSLTVECRSLYYDECMDVFGFDPAVNSNYYKWFFIEKNHLNVNIISGYDLDTIELLDVPKPELVMVDGLEWVEGQDYVYQANTGLGLSDITSGSHSVDIYFEPTAVKGPVAKISANKNCYGINETLVLDGSGSFDRNEDGAITNYLWDFGDGNFTSGQAIVNHYYTMPGVYGIILTVVNSNLNLDHAYFNVTVMQSPTGLFINGVVPDISIKEDTPEYILELRQYEPDLGDSSEEHKYGYFWYLTNEDPSMYSVSGENTTDDMIRLSPHPNSYGSDQVRLWLRDQNGNRVCQLLWINITPVNDPPTIFGIPDITIHFDVPYEFNYLPYITDIDTSTTELKINSSDLVHTSVSGLNVTYTYPESMNEEIVYVIITVWDGQYESSDVVAVWVTDDWVPNLIRPLPDVLLDEGEIHRNYFDLDDYFMDPDNDTLYYSYGYMHVDVIINDDHTVDFYAPEDWNGEEMTTFRATDPSGALIEDIIMVVVIGINDPPVIKNVPDLVVRYEQDYHFDVLPYIYDEDTPVKELTLTTSDPENIRPDPDSKFKIILNYPYRPDIPYTQTVTLTVSDGENSSYQIITVYVKENYPPMLIKPFQEFTFFEDQVMNKIFNLNVHFDDSDSSTLYFTAFNYYHLTVDIDIDGWVSFTSEANWSGQEVITFRAKDPDAAIMEEELRVLILPVNDPPEIHEIPIQIFNTSEKYELDLKPFIYDVDNNITKLTLWLEDCEIDYEIHGTEIIFFGTKPITLTVTLYVSDGQDTSSQMILIEVVDQNPQKDSGSYYEMFLLVTVIILLMVLGIIGIVVRNYLGNYVIKEFFLIYTNGVLIHHLGNKKFKRDESDADIISAMFTAVQEFTRDSFATVSGDGKPGLDDENWKLKKLEFKNNNILLERGENIYIAVVFTGRPGKKLMSIMHKICLDIENNYSQVLSVWDGDMDSLAGISDIIKKYLVISKMGLEESTAPVVDPRVEPLKGKSKK